MVEFKIIIVIYLKYILEFVEFFRLVFKDIEVEFFKVYYEVFED